jgi:hypothetical protein
MLKKIGTYLGFQKESEIKVQYPDDFSLVDVLDLKIDYLKELDKQENERQNTIETKTSQLIGQTGIIFSLLSLFISTYIAKFGDLLLVFQLLLVLIFIFTLLFYLITIYNATKYLNVIKYKYGQRSADTVKNKFKDEEAFKIEEIKDLVYSIERNTKINNQKCDHLIFAYRSFKIANLFVGCLACVLISSSYFSKKPELSKINIDGPIAIQGIDSTINELKNEMKASFNKIKIPLDSSAFK